ncbi:hypothetical protein Tco_0002324 [Tanacetum coccineum]
MHSTQGSKRSAALDLRLVLQDMHSTHGSKRSIAPDVGNTVGLPHKRKYAGLPPSTTTFVTDAPSFLAAGFFQHVHSNISYIGENDFLKNDIRINPNLDSLGALGDTGWYSIRAILWANDYELPKTVTAFRDPEYNELGVILSCGASLN